MRESAAADGSSVSVAVVPGLEYINLRGQAADKAFVSKVNSVLRSDLPLAANTFESGMSNAYWLGPDEWLITSVAGERDTLPVLLEDAISGAHATMNILSGGMICLRVSGRSAALLLNKGCPLDLHPRAFGAGQCAQSGLARASVLVAKLDEKPTFEVFVRRSFADYVAKWLQHAGGEFGIRFEY